MATKLIDMVLGTRGTGPTAKSLARLKDPAKELMRKEIIGKISELCQLIV